MIKQYESYQYRKDINETGELIGKITHRPNSAIIIMIIAGILLCLIPSRFSRIIGITAIVLSCIFFLVTKDYPVMEVFSDALILYQPFHSELAVRIPLEDIAEWNLNGPNGQQLFLRLSDGSEISEECFQVSKADKMLRKILSDKETWVLQRKQMEKIQKENPSRLKLWWRRHFHH